MEFNAVLSSMLGLKFLVLGTQLLEASWATPRKRDGNPGWLTLWRGLDKLLLAIRGYSAMNQKCG